jgi:hypothetical protein
LKVYVVWVPVLSRMSPEGLTGAARASAQRLTDVRIRHYRDDEALLADRFAPTLGLPEDVPAWDVFLLFAPGTRWDEEPPAPAFWMHQLDRGPPAHRLDVAKLATEVERLRGVHSQAK